MTDTVDPSSVPAPPRRTRTVRVGVVVMLVSVAVGIATGVKVGISVAEAVNGPTLTAPGSVTVDADSDTTYVVYEKTGTRTQTGPITFSQRSSTTIGPRQVTVTAPDGSAVRVSSTGSATETATVGSDTFVGVASFDATNAGPYQVTVHTPGGTQASMLVGPSVGSLFAANAIWLIAGFAAGLTAVAGLVIMFVGLIRRGRAQRRLPPPPSGPIGTEPAWPPPAAGPASR